MGMAPREASLDYEGLQAHWRSEHADLASQLEGLRSYVQNHAVLEHGRPLFPYVGFDACSELEWDSLEAMDAAFASEHYQQAVVTDEKSGLNLRVTLSYSADNLGVQCTTDILYGVNKLRDEKGFVVLT